MLLVHGVEISTLFGDFVIFSPDLDYLATFRDVQEAPRAGELPDDAAVVWVHPAAGGGRSGSAYYPGLERLVAEIIDAVEVYNGSWLGDRYVKARREHRRAARRGAHRRQRRARGPSSSCVLHGAARPGARPPPTWSPPSRAGAPCRRAAAPARHRRFGIF